MRKNGRRSGWREEEMGKEVERGKRRTTTRFTSQRLSWKARRAYYSVVDPLPRLIENHKHYPLFLSLSFLLFFLPSPFLASHLSCSVLPSHPSSILSNHFPTLPRPKMSDAGSD